MSVSRVSLFVLAALFVILPFAPLGSVEAGAVSSASVAAGSVSNQGGYYYYTVWWKPYGVWQYYGWYKCPNEAKAEADPIGGTVYGPFWWDE